MLDRTHSFASNDLQSASPAEDDIENIIAESEILICPHLGLENRSHSVSEQPVAGNQCFVLKKPFAPNTLHQASHCLSANYIQCPFFPNPVINTLPAEPATPLPAEQSDLPGQTVSKSSEPEEGLEDKSKPNRGEKGRPTAVFTPITQRISTVVDGDGGKHKQFSGHVNGHVNGHSNENLQNGLASAANENGSSPVRINPLLSHRSNPLIQRKTPTTESLAAANVSSSSSIQANPNSGSKLSPTDQANYMKNDLPPVTKTALWIPVLMGLILTSVIALLILGVL